MTPTGTPQPPLKVSIDSAWGDARAFYDERDWESALTWLIAVRRTDADFEKARIDDMLVNTLVQLAMQATVAQKYDQAIDHWKDALDVRADSENIAEMRDLVTTLAQAKGDPALTDARKAVQNAFADYAAGLAGASLYCSAFDAMQAALRVVPAKNDQLATAQAGYQKACADSKAQSELQSLSGSVFYSAQLDGHYRILRLPLGGGGSSALVVDNAAQPAARPDGRFVAFYSYRQDMQGLTGFDLTAGLDPNDRTVRYSDFTEDSHDSPPSWNPQGDRLVYASRNGGDRRSRIFLVWADGSRNTTSLGYGKDPAWHPSQDLIVFNGVDPTGNQPGLWLVHADGSGATRLTDNGNDQRPTWSPDGHTVIFMSSGRDNNWELYRVDLLDPTRTVGRLTNNPAQDGLPAVSPDGKYVAFMSDRDGYWRLWYIALESGEAHPLARITGELPKWLEHGIQWVK